MTTLIPNINKDFLDELFSIQNEDSIKRLDNRSINEYRQISINNINQVLILQSKFVWETLKLFPK